MDYLFCKPLGLIVVSAKRMVTAEDLKSFHKKLLSDPEIPPGMKEIIDLRQIDVVAVPAQLVWDISVLEKQQADRVGTAHIAVVAPQPAAFGLGRMYEGLAGGTAKKVGVFSELDPALEWLGISREEIKRHLPDFDA